MIEWKLFRNSLLLHHTACSGDTTRIKCCCIKLYAIDLSFQSHDMIRRERSRLISTLFSCEDSKRDFRYRSTAGLLLQGTEPYRGVMAFHFWKGGRPHKQLKIHSYLQVSIIKKVCFWFPVRDGFLFIFYIAGIWAVWFASKCVKFCFMSCNYQSHKKISSAYWSLVEHWVLWDANKLIVEVIRGWIHCQTVSTLSGTYS